MSEFRDLTSEREIPDGWKEAGFPVRDATGTTVGYITITHNAPAAMPGDRFTILTVKDFDDPADPKTVVLNMDGYSSYLLGWFMHEHIPAVRLAELAKRLDGVA